jgi:PadR family transcriptional regulator AphA
MLKFAILGYLNYKSMFGYELKQAMDGSIQHFWHSKLSQIYMTLKQLESDKKLKSEVENQNDKPDRKRYTITDLGRQELQEWLNQSLMEIPQNKDELLLKLFFSANVDMKNILNQLYLMRKLHSKQLDVYKIETKKIILETKKNIPTLARDAVLWEATRRMGEMYETMYIDWLDETIATIEKKLKRKTK